MIGGLAQAWLARHGETEWNRSGRRQGQLDSALTPEGIEQSRCGAELLAGQPIDALFASPQGRAMATARLFAQALGQSVRVLDDLREVDHGEVAGLTDTEIEVAYPELIARRRRDKYRFRFPGGESYADADRRSTAALALIAATGAARPLIVSHEMIGRMLLRTLLDLTPADALALRQEHSTIFRVDVCGDLVQTRPDRAARLHKIV